MAGDKKPQRPQPVSVDPETLAMLQAIGFDPGQVTVPRQEEEQLSLAELLVGTAMDITTGGSDWQAGYLGALTTGASPVLPHWVQEMGPEVLQHPDFDPYLGIVSQEGDEMVFMGFEDVKPERVGKRDQHDPGVTPSEARAAGIDHNTTPASGGMEAGGLTPSEARAAGLDHNEYPKKRKQDRTVTFQAALGMPYVWEDEERDEAMRKMREAGLNVTDFDGLNETWQWLVDRAAKTYGLTQGKKKVTPWDVLEMSKREKERAGSLVDYENGTQARTVTSVTEISEGASWKVLQQTLSTLLGRDPSDQELRDYAYRMNSLAAKNPSVTESITQYKAGQVVGERHTAIEPGFDANDMAKAAYDQAQDDPDYARVQGATTYWNAMMQALGAVGDV